MTEEELKAKFFQAAEQLRKIRNDISDINDDFTNIKNFSNEVVTTDNMTVNEAGYYNSKNALLNAYNSVQSAISVADSRI